MPENYYRVGAVAKRLSVTPHTVRRLCEAGMIEADLTTSNQWRVPEGEVERLLRDGVPSIPAAPPPPDVDPDPDQAPPPARPNPTPAGVDVPDAPEVRQAKTALAVTRSRLERRRLELEEEELNDSFREREERRRKREAEEEEQRRQAQEAAERERRKAAEAEKRKRWEEQHVRDALSTVPLSVIGDLRLRVADEVRAVLATRRPADDSSVTAALVRAARDKALFPMRRFQIAQDAVRQLPMTMQDGELADKVRKAAAAALASMANVSTDEELTDAAEQAVRPFVKEAEHQVNMKSELGRLQSWMLFTATEEERKKARGVARRALESLPVGTKWQAMRQAIEKALKPLEAEIEERKAQEELRRRAEEIAGRAETLLYSALGDIYEYEDYRERQAEARKLAPQLAPQLRRAVMRGELDAPQAGEFVSAWLESIREDDEEDED